MPPDPKKPIEELLEASANARRAEFGADPGMPNPMRARLHDEIARLDREDPPRERRSWLAAFWPQISIAAAVLVTASVLWLNHHSNSDNESRQLAMRAPAGARPDTALKSLDATNQVGAQTESASDETVRADAVANGSLADNSTVLKPDGVAIASAAPAVPARSDDAARELNERAKQIAQAPVVAANAPSENFKSAVAAAPAFKKEADAGNLQQQFSQTARGQALRSNAKLKQAANVLNTFQVEQDGRRIRLVDADGSTYTGKFEPIVRSSASRMLKQTTPGTEVARRESGSAAATNELYFRATGYSDSLKKEVVFEGNYIAAPPPPQSADFKKDGQAPARIVGTAKAPGESPVEVDAIAVTR